MNAKMSMAPDSMSGGRVSRPEPCTMLTTPGGKHSRKSSSVGTWHRQPVRGVLRMQQLPMIRAGMRLVYVSLNG